MEDAQGRLGHTFPTQFAHSPMDLFFSHPDPQIYCPICDDNMYGAEMNKDLFPELADRIQ